jgi:quercetin dioxygenase-like cupin family protein
MELKVVRWDGKTPPSAAAVRAAMQADGYRFYAWSNGPGDVYAPHTHSYHKVLAVASGEITFILPEQNRRLTLQAGDRLYLPAGTRHAAEVGPQGVTCLEAHV